MKAVLKKIVGLVVVGLLLRLTGILVWPFGFDQVQIIENAHKIVSGDLTLIGPRTGPASLFTGPLIYYLVALFWWVGLQEWSLVAGTLCIAVVTGGVMYYLWRRYFGRDLAFVATLLWVGSSVLIRYDQVTWNPNLMLLAASLVALPLFGVVRQHVLRRLDYSLLFLGGFLAYQAHFAGFLLVPLSALFLWQRSKAAGFAAIVSVCLGLGVSLTPTLWFDYRHDWLNLKGLLAFSQQVTEVSHVDAFSTYAHSLWKSFYTTFEGLGSLVMGNFTVPVEISFLIGLAIFSYYIFIFLWQKNNINTEHGVVLAWVILSCLLLSLYKGDKPPYYFLLQYPVFMLLWVQVFLARLKPDLRRILVVIWLMAAVLQAAALLRSPGSLSLLNLLRVRAALQQVVRQIPAERFVLHLPTGENFGVEYMLRDLPLVVGAAQAWHVAYPGDEVVFAQRRLAGIALWHQPITTESNLYFTNEFRISTPAAISLYRDGYDQSTARDRLLIIKEQTVVGELRRFNRYDFVQLYTEKSFPVQVNQWQWMDALDMAVYQYGVTKELFVLSGSIAKELYTDVAIF